MIIVDSGMFKVGGVLLPGTFEKVEVDSDAKVDEVDVKGKSVKPKQATGYEDAKITIVVNLRASEDEDEYSQLARIQNIFKKPGQEKPNVYDIFNMHLNTRGIDKVIFKKLTTKENNQSNILQVTCEFWEYIPISITASKNKSGEAATSSSNVQNTQQSLTKEYESYLSDRKNKLDKTKETAAVDDDAASYRYL